MAVSDHYAGTAPGWARAAARVYGPLAADLVAAVPARLAGATVLDAGAGTGLVSAALQAAGARPVQLDLSLDMLCWQRDRRPPALVAGVDRIPLRTSAVDAALAAFVLNHLTDPAAALRELARVTRPGGPVLATVYANSSRSAVRDRVDGVALAHGFTWPAWYVELKEVAAPLLGTTAAMAAAARGAGLAAVRVVEYVAETGLRRPEELVDYRFSQAQFRPWISALSPRRRDAVRTAAITAVTPIMEPYRPRVVRLVAAAPQR